MGLLIVYNSSSRAETTALHRLLFGRIVSMGKSRKYYYPGILEDIKYFKINDGCYYIVEPITGLSEINIESYPCSMDIDESKLCTAKEHWTKHKEEKKYIVKGL